jgi:hypothetical protein
VFGTADIQSWNYPDQKIPIDLIEPLQSVNCKQNGTAFKDNGEAAED